jgi:hypothetical protein
VIERNIVEGDTALESSERRNSVLVSILVATIVVLLDLGASLQYQLSSSSPTTPVSSSSPLPATKHNSPTRGSERKISEILDLEVIPAIGDP